MSLKVPSTVQEQLLTHLTAFDIINDLLSAQNMADFSFKAYPSVCIYAFLEKTSQVQCYECVSSAHEGACSLLRHRCWALCGRANYQRYVCLLDAEMTFSTVALTTRLAELTQAPTHSLAHTYCREILLLSYLVGGAVCSWPFTQKQPQRRSPPSPSANSSSLKVHRREMAED